MNALQAIKDATNVASTENGDVAFATSNSACLDMFALCGGMRENTKDLVTLFVKAFYEDPITAIKILFYMRNIRGGLGERKSFRVLLTALARLHPSVAKQVLYAIPIYGRWDDMFVLLYTQLKYTVIEHIRQQLSSDVLTTSPSLLGKWLPSINTSSKQYKREARIIMKGLGMKAADYRKLCSDLRKKINILEDYLRRRDYTFDYSKQPSQAMLRHKKAFSRNDEERYNEFLKKVVDQTEKLARGEEISPDERVKLNTSTLYPYQIVAQYIRGFGCVDDLDLPAEQQLALEASWKALKRSEYASKTIVVRDGSGSMYSNYGGRNKNATPINVATSLALFFAEQLRGEFENSFITFSELPQLIQIPTFAKTLKSKLNYISTFNECANTNIGAVYELLLKVAKNKNVPAEEMIDQVLIISDMEFDTCAKETETSTFEYYKTKFKEAGYKLPEIVFWNVAARDIHLPVTENETGVKLVSGASASIFADVMNNDIKVVTPREFMMKMLEPYAEFDKLVINS